MPFPRMQELASQWLARFAQPDPALVPYPGWYLGAGERRSGHFATVLRRQIWYAIDAPVLTPWLDGLRIYAYPKNETSRCLFVTGRYEPNEFCFLNQILQPGMVFLDIGANMGLYTVFAARKVGERGTVVAVEASSRECERLLRNVAINSLSNVRLVRKAVSDSSSEADLLVATDERSGHNTLGAFMYDTVAANKERVHTERLDDIVRREGLVRVDAAKLDVEGAELRVLRGAVEVLERFRPVLLLEIADPALRHQGCDSAQIWDFLRQRNYRLFEFDQRTGAPVPAVQKPFYQSENLIAVPDSYEPNS